MSVSGSSNAPCPLDGSHRRARILCEGEVCGETLTPLVTAGESQAESGDS